MQKKIGNYEIGKQIGKGGFGAVYHAVHKTLNTEYAIKVLNPDKINDESTRQRFIREAQITAKLNHPNIVQVHDLIEEDENLYIVMDYYPQKDLVTWLEKNKPVSRLKIIEILEEIANALDYLHENSKYHRDLKPSNILMDSQGFALLSDFGLVYLPDKSALTKLGSVVGTATYMSPEQAQDLEVDGRSDQYSLGVMAFELLVGQPPFVGETPSSLSLLLMRLQSPPPKPTSLNPELPHELDPVFQKALAIEVEERYESCGDFARALREALESSTIREFRELINSAQGFMRDNNYDEAEKLLEKAALLAPDRTELKKLLENIEAERADLKSYTELVRNWDRALAEAQNVLDMIPDYPDENRIFSELGLRKLKPKLPSLKVLAKQLRYGFFFSLIPLLLIFLASWYILAFILN